MKLLRPGGLIAIDNVLWSGDVVDERINDIDTESHKNHNINNEFDTIINNEELLLKLHKGIYSRCGVIYYMNKSLTKIISFCIFN